MKRMRRMNRIISALLICAVLVSQLPVTASAAAASGSCGTTARWSLSNTGTLTIFGSGAIKNMPAYENIPWKDHLNSIQKIVVGSQITSIGTGAFSYCSAVTAVELPGGLTKIGDYAFTHNQSLPEIELPAGVTSLGKEVFTGCESLESIRVAEGNSAFACVDGVLFNKSKTVLLAYPGGRSGDYAVPAGTTAIGEYAFSSNHSLGQVSLPTSVATIGTYAFSASWLKGIALSPGLTTIAPYAFSGCSALGWIELPAGLTSIGTWAFAFSGLRRVDILADAVEIDSAAFTTCLNLTDIYFTGSAPDVVSGSGDSNSFDSGMVTLHYIPGTSGWTDSPGYNSAASTWNGYGVQPWNPYLRIIEQLTGDGIMVNGTGRAWGLFRLTDYAGAPLSGIRVDYLLNGTAGHAVTDGNGVFRVGLPAVTANRVYPIAFSIADFSHELHGDQQTISVFSKYSYTKSWTGSLGNEVELGLGGVGAAVGVAELEAAIAKASLKGGTSGEYEVKDSYAGGERTLELTYTHANEVGVKFKSGVEATLPISEIKPVSASAELTRVSQSAVGLKLEHYDPTDPADLSKVGAFNLQVALTGKHSAWVNAILDLLDVGAHNQSAYKEKLIAGAGANLGVIETPLSSGVEVGDDKWSIAAADMQLVLESERKQDYLEGTTQLSQGLTTDYGFSLLKNLIPGTSAAAGLDDCNRMELAAKFDPLRQLQGMTFTMATEGTKDILWDQYVEETGKSYHLSTQSVPVIAAGHPQLQRYLNWEVMMLNPAVMVGVAAGLGLTKADGTTEYEKTVKTGKNLRIPIGVGLGVNVEAELKGSFEEAVTFSNAGGMLVDGDEYVVSCSDLTVQDVKATTKTFSEIVSEPLDTVMAGLKNWFSSVGNAIADGVEQGAAAIRDAGRELWVTITEVVAPEPAVYAVMTLANEQAPDTSAAVAVTLGKPYMIAAYEDESMTVQVSDAVLAEEPLPLTLSYDQEMLASAGASVDSEVVVFCFDARRNAYIPVENCLQDREAMTVSAQIVRQGEYILGTDSASPLISDFALSDGTGQPTLSLLVSDFSGIAEFTLWLDGESNVLLDGASFADYYDPESGYLTYDFPQPLAAGEHTVYAQAVDHKGNANAQPFAFPFYVDAAAPEIGEITLPLETVVDEGGFHVTAAVTDDAAVTQVMLNAVDNRGEKRSLAMTEEGTGLWSVDVVDLAGLSTMDVSVLAMDAAGNRAESRSYTVRLSVPAQPEGLHLSVDSTAGVSVAVANYDPRPVSGWLIAAVYDGQGKMLETGSVYIGLQGEESGEYDLPLTVGAECSVKAFLLDGTGSMLPVTGAADPADFG